MLETMPAALQWLLKRLGGGDKVKKGVTVEYQYCTAGIGGSNFNQYSDPWVDEMFEKGKQKDSS